MSADTPKPTDPLDGADVGETRTEEYTTELWLGDIAEFDDVIGGDRTAEHRLTDTEVVTDDVGDEMLRITVESDITKRLPRDWDRESQETTDRRTDSRGFSKADAFRLIASGGIAVAVATLVFQRVLAEVPEGPVEFTGPTLGPVYEILPLILLVVLIVAAIPYLPRLARGGRWP